MPGEGFGSGLIGEDEEVRAFRCERRNMFDLPTMQGAMATVLMAV